MREKTFWFENLIRVDVKTNREKPSRGREFKLIYYRVYYCQIRLECINGMGVKWGWVGGGTINNVRVKIISENSIC